MTESREEKIARALGEDWEYAEGVGYCYKGNHQRERGVIDRYIRQRVRELWLDAENRMLTIDYLKCGDVWLYFAHTDERGIDKNDYVINRETEAAAWEEALLFLWKEG